MPRIEGVRDIVTAMDFVLTAIDNPKQHSPEFVKFRDEIVKVVSECEAAIAKAGDAEEIEKAAVLAASTAAKGEATKIIDAAKARAKRVEGKAADDAESRTLTLNASQTALDEAKAALTTRDSETTSQLDAREAELKRWEAALEVDQEKLRTDRKSLVGREGRLKVAQDKVNAAKQRLAAAGIRMDD